MIAYTFVLTILGGFLIFAAGQIFLKLFLDPVHEYRQLVGQIADNLIYYANIYSSPSVSSDDVKEECHQAFRQRASELIAKANAILAWKLFEYFRLIPRKESIFLAHHALIGLSNFRASLPDDILFSHRNKETIQEELGIVAEFRETP